MNNFMRKLHGVDEEEIKKKPVQGKKSGKPQEKPPVVKKPQEKKEALKK